MDTEHRKIELQSPADLTYLTSQIRTLARQKLDLHLPAQPDTTEPDELRKQVEDRVDAFVAQVIAGMRHNISINGIDVVKRGSEGKDAMDIDTAGGVEDGIAETEEFAPFDEKLRSQLAATTQKRDLLISKISQHRRTTPGLAARKFEEQFAREMEVLDKAQVESENAVLQSAEEGVVGVEALKRAADVQRAWEKAAEGLGMLNKGLPETRARLERCGEVVEYVRGGKGKA